MHHDQANPRGRWNTLVLRAFWLFMILGHAPAIVNTLFASPDAEGSWAKTLLLVGAQLFFIAKLVDPAWLRCGFNRRMQIATVAIVLLLHVGVFERVMFEGEPLPPTFQLLTVGGGFGAFGKLLRREPAFDNKPDRQPSRVVWRITWHASHQADLPPRCFALLCHCTPHRAPPR